MRISFTFSLKSCLEENITGKDPEPQKKEERVYHCNDCGGPIYKHQVFCDKCGKALDHFDFED